MTVNVEHYTYRVVWSEGDQEFAGLCVELPSLSWLDSSLDAALIGILALVRSVVDDMISAGERPPEPLSERRFSGKFQVRTTPERHRLLAIEAAEAGVSINRLINDRLAG